MIRRLAGVAILGAIGAGCGGTGDVDSVAVELPDGATSAVAPPQPASAPGAGEARVPIEGGVVVLAPGNTQISFVGGKPDGSTHFGGFRDFSGEIQVDPETNEPRSITATIKTDSIFTDNERLTGHLKSPDFFEVREYPEATFQTTAIEPAEDGYQVTGDLTLHGTTSSISFPARIDISDDGLSLASSFTIDRLAFGIDYQPDQINKDVQLTVAVGAAAARQAASMTPVPAGSGGPSEGSDAESEADEGQPE